MSPAEKPSPSTAASETDFARPERLKLLAFGFLLAFFSSFGQTFFISLFSADFRASFDLSHGGFGTVYSLATLASGLSMIRIGGLLDRMPLRRFVMATLVGLSIACLLTFSVQSVLMLGIALFLLRLCGQGLMVHAAITSMARHFERSRGKAIAFATMGNPAGEAVFPLTLVVVTAAVGWRNTWLLAATFLLLVLLPVVLLLLRGGQAGSFQPKGGSRFRLGPFVRQPRFLLMLPGLMASGFISTGVFFHQIHITEVKGWDLAWFATCFVGFAAASVCATLLSGVLIDRLTARRIMPFYLIPLALACLVMSLGSAPWVALAYMLLAGLTAGSNTSVTTAMWAETYGTAQLGSIRAVAAALMVISTALAPGLLGLLIDAGVSVDALLAGCSAYCLLGIVMYGLVFRRDIKGTSSS
ncbi:MFS transporter [Fodinicurvata fenggangensis]|uniref:MFS transporter n=1 Tax=Fodinicurvata fenggangensis TaxID=1121830 RepID=UPI00068BD980|nr:MFS transporter [Fodinicurvata fenggangensis]